MKRLIALLTVLGFVAATGSIYAADPTVKPAAETAVTPAAPVKAAAPSKAAAAPKKSAKKKSISLTGNVVSVDIANSQLVIKDAKKDATQTITVDAKTKIKKDKNEIKLSEIEVGNRVTARYKIEADKNMATSLSVSIPKPEKKSKSEKK